MIRINLLPWREERRKHRRQQFYTLLAVVAGVGLAIAALVHTIIAGVVDNQEQTNAFLKREIAALDTEIAEIKRLREQTDALLARKQVIESLQGNRAEAVNLFNELARQVPEGIYLKLVKQQGPKVTLVGYAQSNARVSTLMRNLEASPHLEKPDLVEIKAAIVEKRRLSEFNLTIMITRAAEEKKADGAATPGGKKA